MWLNAVVMNGRLQATSKVEIDPEATEKLQVTMANFRHALLNDVKPVSGILLLELSVHQSVNYRDIIVVQDVTDNLQQTSCIEPVLKSAGNRWCSALNL